MTGRCRTWLGRARLVGTPARLVAAAWALAAVRITRRRLRADGIQAASPRSPRLPATATPTVIAILNRLEPTCLERSLVLQRWLADRGYPFEVAIGVRRDATHSVLAHAWLEFEEPAEFAEILRLAPPSRC